MTTTGDARVDSAFARMISTASARQRELAAWLPTVPQTIPCQRHPDVSRSIVLERSRVGEAYYGPCHQCRADLAARAEADRLQSMGVPLNLCGATLDNWKPYGEADEAILEQCRKFARDKRGFLLLLGDLGTGKTHMAVAILRTFSRGWLVKQSELLRRLRATYRDRAAVDPVDAAQDASLLVLDEVGLSAGGRDELPLLHDVLDHRHGNQKPTILTGNLGTDQLAAVIGDRMADRLKESAFAVLVLSGASNRAEARDRYFRGAE